jgi:hypothetical protein
MAPTPEHAPVVVGRFNPALVFRLGDPLTLPLLRLMLATDDVRHAGMLFLKINHQGEQSVGILKTLLGGQLWYAFRLLCSHLKEGGDALKTLTNSVGESRLRDLLRGRPVATDALDRLRSAFGSDAFISKVRHSIGFHYRQADIERVFKRDLAAERVKGVVVACEPGLLSRFTITDVLALHMLDEAAGSDLSGGEPEFVRRAGEVVALVGDLSTFVGHLVDVLLERHGVEVTHETIEVPALLRAARDAVEKAQAEGRSQHRGGTADSRPDQ